VDHGPSLTARRVAFRRAAHQLIDRPPVHEDPLAIRILGPAAAAELRADPRRREGGPIAPYLRAFLAVRSRIAEDELGRAVARGVGAYVVLGAGLDTFAYRNPHPGLRVLEVDHPATQAWKREQLARVGIDEPAGVTFAPIDFGTQDLAGVLRDAGLRAGQPAFFSWLGVTPYLEAASVLATLRALVPFVRGGGAVVFDYSEPPETLDPARRAAFELLAARVRAAGEPFRSFFEPGRIAAELHGIGFSRLVDLGPDALNALHFSGRSDGLTVGRLAHVLTASA
jgi:methyltransferase (TIGR00027 family)